MPEYIKAKCSICPMVIDVNDYYNHMEMHSMIQFLDGNEQIDYYNDMTFDYQMEQFDTSLIYDFDKLWSDHF